MNDKAAKLSALVIASISSFLTPFMISSVNIALPAIGKEFKTDAVMLSWVATSYLLAASVSLVPFGKLADMICAIQAYWLASFWQTLLVFYFVQIESLNSFYIFAIIFGFGYAGVMTGLLVCVRMLTPLSRRASALGIVLFFAWLGHGIGGYQGGLFFDLTDDYKLTYTNAALAGILNLIIVGALFHTIKRRTASLKLQS